MNRLVLLALGFALAVLAWNSYYGFALVGILEADQLRGTFERPAVLRYLTPALIGAALPFAFAYFACQRRYVVAALSVLLIVCFYPVQLNKTVLLAGVWLPFLFLLYRAFEPKRATVLALLIPMAVGFTAYVTVPAGNPVQQLAAYMFGFANYRMFAFASLALDRYSDFCQPSADAFLPDQPHPGDRGLSLCLPARRRNGGALPHGQPQRFAVCHRGHRLGGTDLGAGIGLGLRIGPLARQQHLGAAVALLDRGLIGTGRASPHQCAALGGIPVERLVRAAVVMGGHAGSGG